MQSSVKIIIFFLLASAIPVAGQKNLDDLKPYRCQWVGHYPSDMKPILLKSAKVTKKIRALIGNDRYVKLLNNEYLEQPINYIDGCFVLDYLSNYGSPHLDTKINDVNERFFIVINEHKGYVCFGLVNEANKGIDWTYYPSSEHSWNTAYGYATSKAFPGP